MAADSGQQLERREAGLVVIFVPKVPIWKVRNFNQLCLALWATSRRPLRYRPCLKTPCGRFGEGVTANVRFNAVVETGVPGFIPRAK
jgi:hypothetical protein